MVTEVDAGAIHPDTALKSTVWLVLESPFAIAPLFRQVPPSTRHCAPAVTAWEGARFALRFPALTLSAVEESRATSSRNTIFMNIAEVEGRAIFRGTRLHARQTLVISPCSSIRGKSTSALAS